ncbi:MAG: beta-hydroxyacyl-ACP dehydratase [Bacteroidaceae bacterium]|nr:beta-hydroxyacyl-ACP dehydratase [Bacteroidaceae bacterium]MBR2458435.1 beta-hydroxyacyl-ACP dehydratase [Bacteroidaceae bacterium]MEE1288145.1 beta-hydroxyacyl-ACP dehydratase [Bacteroidaceae bacterium]
MLLENKFYRVLSEERGEGLSAKYRVAILPECNVYDGHFPGDPVCPGVCNIETIKECAILLCGEQLRYSTIKQCRLTALATPTVCPEVDVQVNLSPSGEGYALQATIADDRQTYMILKGQLDKA